MRETVFKPISSCVRSSGIVARLLAYHPSTPNLFLRAGAVRYFHKSPPRRWAGTSTQLYRRNWNPLDRFLLTNSFSNSPVDAKKLQKSDNGVNIDHNQVHNQNPTTDADVNLLHSLNQTRDYDKVINHFELLRPVSSSLPNSTLINAMDQRLVIEYVKALLATNQLHRLGLDSPKLSSSTGIGPEFRLRLDDSGAPIKVSIKEANKGSWIADILKFGFTVVLSLAAISVLIEGAAQNLPKGLGLGAKKVNAVSNTNTSFKDVKGCEEVKAELQEIISYLTDPEKFTRLGAKLPKGILLSGPPGTGKTLLARAIAGEAKVPFIQASGSEFEEMFVGVGARRIRDLFTAARKMAPAIVFIDEIDAVGSKRIHKENTSVRMTLNQLLVELDGFEQNEGVVVICATNFPESLDSALTRPGRLDKTVVVPLPDLQGRQEILEHYGSKVVLADDADLSILARRTAGMTGADLFNVINIAAVKSSAEGKASVPMEALEHAFDRVVVGLERRNPMSEEERRMTAYHESGHALVSWHTKGTDPVHKATIMPRGAALGITWQIPLGDRYQHKLYELEGRLDVLLGGKAAECLIYGNSEVTAGCSSDLKAATNLARQMVMQFGMGVQTSPVPMYIDGEFYGSLSEDLRQRVDGAVQKLLDAAYQRAINILDKHKDHLEKLAQALVEFETINYEEIQLILDDRASDIPALREAAKKRSETKMESRSQKLLKRLKPSLPDTSSRIDRIISTESPQNKNQQIDKSTSDI